MKKHLSLITLMIAAIIPFTSCDRAELSAPDSAKTGKMKILVSSVDTRTTNDGMSTLWAAGDQLTVWHAAAGSKAYVKDGNTDGSAGIAFSTTETGTSAVFTGSYAETLEPDASYDWYVLYPNKPKLVNPEGDPVGFVGTHNVGVTYQEQADLNSSAHLSGTELLLYGKASAVKGDVMPSVKLAHISSAVKVVITNNSGAPIRPHTVIFTAPEQVSISGQHAIDFTADPMGFTPNPTSASNFVWTNVKGKQALANGESTSVYFSVKPFTAGVGDKLILNVNGYEKTITLTEATAFEAGKIKTINFNYDRADADLSGSYVIGSDTPHGFYLMEGTCLQAKVYASGAIDVSFAKKARKDGDTIYYDDNMKVGDSANEPDVTIDDYKFTVTKVTEGDYAGMYTVQRKNNEYFTAGSSNEGNSTQYLATPTADSYWDITVHGDNYYLVATKSDHARFFKFAYNNGKYPRFLACPYTYTTGEVYEIGLYPVTALQADPLPRLEVKDINAPYEGVTDATTTIAILNNTVNQWEASVQATGCVTAASIAGNVITYSLGANASTEVANGTIVVTLSKNDQKVQATINVVQDGVPNAYYKKVTVNKADWTGEYIMVAEVSETEAYVFYSDDNYADSEANCNWKGTPSFKVALTAQGILASRSVTSQGLFSVVKYSDDGIVGATDAGAVYDPKYAEKYNIFLQKRDQQNEPRLDGEGLPARTGFGVYGNDPSKNVKSNNNSWHSRFALDLEYDTTSGSMHVTSLKNKNGVTGYLRFDTGFNKFDWQAAATTFGPTSTKKLDNNATYPYGAFYVGDYKNSSCTTANGNPTLHFINIQFYELQAE